MSLKSNTKAPSKNSTKKSKIVSENDAIVTILSNVTFGNEKTKLFQDEKQIAKLASIRTKDEKFLLNEEYPHILYEVIGGFYKLMKEKSKDFDKIIDSLENITKDFDKIIDFLETIVKDENFSIEDDDISIIFEAPWFQKEIDSYKTKIDRLKTKISVKKGIVKCPDCIRNNRKPIDNTESVEFQNRSSDEPMALMNSCLNCNYKWVIN